MPILWKVHWSSFLQKIYLKIPRLIPAMYNVVFPREWYFHSNFKSFWWNDEISNLQQNACSEKILSWRQIHADWHLQFTKRHRWISEKRKVANTPQINVFTWIIFYLKSSCGQIRNEVKHDDKIGLNANTKNPFEIFFRLQLTSLTIQSAKMMNDSKLWFVQIYYFLSIQQVNQVFLVSIPLII